MSVAVIAAAVKGPSAVQVLQVVVPVRLGVGQVGAEAGGARGHGVIVGAEEAELNLD